METNNNQVSQPALQPGSVDYAAALRQYQKYGRGRSMKKFCEDENGNRAYKKKYFWSITAKTLKLSWLFYEEGSCGAKAIRPYLEKFMVLYH